MELVLAVISLVVICVVYVHYRYNKSLYETQERGANEKDISI